MYRLKYPFDIYQSLRFTTSLRLDKYFLQSTDRASYEADYNYEKRLSLKLEYVFDNAHDVSVNVKNGTRLKVFSEGINEFDLDLNEGLNVDLSRALTGIIGMDARHYIPVLKHAVLALRATAATSFGNQRVVYYLGGMEQWMFASSEENIPVPDGGNSSFKVLAPQLRGFKNNIRNGNSYMNPNSADNTLNSVFVAEPKDNPIITIQARYFRDPVVYGYGFGARSTVLGYFVKLDYGWGVETGHKRNARLYLSLGMDF